MINLAQMVEDAMFTRLKYKDVCLMIDGGTLKGRKLLHIMIGNADVGVFFFRSIKVDTLNTDNMIEKHWKSSKLLQLELEVYK